MDKVSSSGFAFGYISSVIPFVISLAVIFFLGMDLAIGYQIGFIITALWYNIFCIPSCVQAYRFGRVRFGYGCGPYSTVLGGCASSLYFVSPTGCLLLFIGSYGLCLMS